MAALRRSALTVLALSIVAPGGAATFQACSGTPGPEPVSRPAPPETAVDASLEATDDVSSPAADPETATPAPEPDAGGGAGDAPTEATACPSVGSAPAPTAGDVLCSGMMRGTLYNSYKAAPPEEWKWLQERLLKSQAGSHFRSDDLSRAITPVLPRLRNCYTAAAACRPGLRGRLVLALTLKTDWSYAVALESADDALDQTGIIDCAARAVCWPCEALSAPADRDVHITRPFEFAPADAPTDTDTTGH